MTRSPWPRATLLAALALAGTSSPGAAQEDAEAFRSLKGIELGDDLTLSLAGEARVRGEWTRRPDFGLDGPANDDVVLNRLLLSADLRAGRALRAFVQLGHWVATDRDAGRAATDESRLDLAQGYVDLSAGIGLGRGTLRAGRQEMSFGSSRLVSVRESPNIRRSFDGARVFWSTEQARFDAFVTRPVRLFTGSFDDEPDGREVFWGAYGTVSPGGLSVPSLDVYYLGLGRDRSTFAQGSAQERRHTVGGRLFGATGGWDWDLEAAAQFGTFGDARIRAWTLASDVGLTLGAVAWEPRLGLKADVASGDGDLSDGTLGTFNALYPKVPYFSEAGLVAPANVADLQPTLSVKPIDALELGVGWNVLWRHRSEDAFYAPPLSPVPGTEGGGRFIGHQAQVSAEWTPTPNVELKAWYVHFFAGDTIERAGGRDVDYVAASAAFKF